mgnify:CR=1 FL=1
MHFKLALIFIFLPFSSVAEKLVRVTFDETTICYPKSYSPNTSLMDSILAPIKGELDDSAGQQLVYIPAQRIKNKVPEYSLSHANDYNPKVMHDVNGIIYPLSTIDINGLSDNAWNIHQEIEKPIIYKDPKTDLFKVFTFKKEIGPWHLVKSAPVKNSIKQKAKDWYVGFCGKLAGSYNCKVNVVYKDIVYNYSLNEHNVSLHKQVEAALLEEIKSWENACPES